MTRKILNSTIQTRCTRKHIEDFPCGKMAIVIFPRVEARSDFYYIKVKVTFPEDGVVKEFYYEKIQSYYHYHYNCSCISNTFCFG